MSNVDLFTSWGVDPWENKKNNAYDEKNLSGSHFFDSCTQQMVFLPFSKLGKHYEKNEDINYLPWPALCYLICFPQLLFWYQVSHFPLLPEFLKKEGFIWVKK